MSSSDCDQGYRERIMMVMSANPQQQTDEQPVASRSHRCFSLASDRCPVTALGHCSLQQAAFGTRRPQHHAPSSCHGGISFFHPVIVIRTRPIVLNSLWGLAIF